MDLTQIRELLEIVAESGVEEVKIEEDDFKLTIRKSAPTITMQQGPQPAPYALPGGVYPPLPYAAPSAGGGEGVPPAQPQPTNAAATGAPAEPEAGVEAAPPEPAASEDERLVTAPIVGTFYRCPSPDDDPYVEEGDRVEPGDVLCIIEAMKLMNEIESEVSGTIGKILVEDAQPVEYEQPLFVIESS